MSASTTSPSLELLYRRGMISGWWIAAPVGVSLSTAAALVLWQLHVRDDPTIAFVAAFYACIAFFAHAYSVAWRAGTFFWQYLALLVVIAQLSIASWLHLDASGTQGTLGSGLIDTVAPGGELFVVAAALDALAAVLLLLHCTVLGFGIREPLPTAEYAAITDDQVTAVDDADVDPSADTGDIDPPADTADAADADRSADADADRSADAAEVDRSADAEEPT